MESAPRDGGIDATRYKRAATLLLATPDLPFALIPALNAAAAILPQAAYRVADSPDGRAFEDVLDAAGVLGYLRATADTLLVLRRTSESVFPRSFRHLLNSTQVAFHAATLRTVLDTLIHAAEAGEEPLPALLLSLGSRQWKRRGFARRAPPCGDGAACAVEIVPRRTWRWLAREGRGGEDTR